jgi:hypothetical protein
MARMMDRASDFYTTDAVGRTQEMTPEGFLVCRDVPVARTGSMFYAPGELQDDQGNYLTPGPDGIITAYRDADEVFRPETIASLNGKSIVDDHPEEDVNPENWGDHTVGVVLNPRRGEGPMDQMLLADFLVTKKTGIDAVRRGKKEVSCGYDASYEQTEPGQARQRNIIYNHVALVDHGRCGPRCAIGDSDMSRGRNESFSDRIMRMVRARDEDGVEDALRTLDPNGGEGGGGPEPEDTDQHIHIHLPGGGGAPAGAGGGGEGPPGAAGPTESQDQPTGEGHEDTPPWFQQHVQQNNARFDKVEAALAKLGGGAGAGGGNGEHDEGGAVQQQQVDPAELQKEPDGTPAKDNEPNEAELTEPDQGGEEGRKEPKDTTDALGKGPFGTKAQKDVSLGKGPFGAKVADSATLMADFQDTIAKAEIICPGTRMPTYDAAEPAKATCLLRRRVLAKALRTDDDKSEIVRRVMGDTPNLVGMTCDAVATAFNAVAAMSAMRNNGVISGAATYDRLPRPGDRGPPSNAELNKRHREFWKDRV